jgi:hypothetical protein
MAKLSSPNNNPDELGVIIDKFTRIKSKSGKRQVGNSIAALRTEATTMIWSRHTRLTSRLFCFFSSYMFL